MRGNFEEALNRLWTKSLEAKGRCRWGPKAKTIASWRGCLVGAVDLSEVQKGEAAAILHSWFWRGVMADDLPDKVDYAVFARAVRDGPKTAIVALQVLLRGVRPTGEMDGKTLRAVEKADATQLIAALRGSPDDAAAA